MTVDETSVSNLDYFNRTLYNKTHTALKIYTLRGQLMYQGEASEVYLEAWPAGVYVVKTADEVMKVMR